jgi:hypothetical protein
VVDHKAEMCWNPNLRQGAETGWYQLKVGFLRSPPIDRKVDLNIGVDEAFREASCWKALGQLDDNASVPRAM